MGWFTGRRVKGMARTLALITALSMSCFRKSNEFTNLVASEDKEVAAQIVKNPQRGKDRQRVLACINHLKQTAQQGQRLLDKPKAGLILNHDFLRDLENFFNEDLNGENYYTFTEQALQDVKRVGLTHTAQDLRTRQTNYFLNLDRELAPKIWENLGDDFVRMGKLSLRSNQNQQSWLMEQNVAHRLATLGQKAKRAGFTITGQALLNASEKVFRYIHTSLGPL